MFLSMSRLIHKALYFHIHSYHRIDVSDENFELLTTTDQKFGIFLTKHYEVN